MPLSNRNIFSLEGRRTVKVIIVGANFAALAAIERLRDLDLGRNLQLVVVAPKPEFFYQPSLIWIPTKGRTSEQLHVPLTPFFERMGVDFVPAHAIGAENGGRTLLTTAGPMDNDALLIASGGDYLKKAPGIEHHALIPCQLAHANRARDTLEHMTGGHLAFGFAGNPNEPTAIRGGPMFEFMFCIDNHLRKMGLRKKFVLTFFSPMAEPGKRMGPKAVSGLLATMEKRGIQTHLGHKITRFKPDGVETEKGQIPSDMTLFIPGMTGQPWFAKTGFPLSPGGFIQAEGTGLVTGTHRVYVAGDAGFFPGPDWRAKQAHMAQLQAAAAAENIFLELHGKPAQKTFRTELICIVDTEKTGIFVSRFERFGLILPPMFLMHLVKVGFERWIMDKYR
ncbi:MAG: NAD(P)/FAD-dependent oxidoreductase [Nitrospirae bacterium]|nr:NAD(P)/FAD-dependent oxidoreductase [Magnetococcales bacterium]HAT51609.1 pyridine nucleotide-disulfide oxidoreductase [Alphaproteobacteria bacterium]